MSKYYEDACDLAYRMTKWSNNLKSKKKRFVVTSGGGPGIMEAANNHEVLISIEEGSVGGFGSHVMQFLSDRGVSVSYTHLTLPTNREV